MPNFYVSNVFAYGENNPDVSYERAYMATPSNEYFTDILDHLTKYHDNDSQRLSSKKLKEAVLPFMEDEAEEI